MKADIPNLSSLKGSKWNIFRRKLLLAPFLIQGGYAMAKPPDAFSFEYFERLPDAEAAPQAQEFLRQQFPPGSDVAHATTMLKAAGADCRNGDFGNGRPFVGCYYSRPGHGLMALVSTIEWKIIIWTDASRTKVLSIEVGRGATGL